MSGGLICPGCGHPAGGTTLVGEQVRGVYDGILIWHHETCGHAWPRFQPDAESGYSRLHYRAAAMIAARRESVRP